MTVRRVTVVRTEPLADASQAREWLAGARNRSSAAQEVSQALSLANRVLHAHKLAAADPYQHELGPDSAQRIRLGYGSGDQVADGLWTEARSLPPDADGSRTRTLLDPAPALAQMLSGASPRRPGDDLLLRARLDFEQGRVRQAALQARVAEQALAAEGMEIDTNELDRIADAALVGELDATQTLQLEQMLASMQRWVRRRMHTS